MRQKRQGGLFAAAVFLLPVLTHPLCRVGAGTVMALLAFRREVRPWRLTALFWLLSGGLAGLLLALGLLTGSPMGLLRRIYYANISWLVLLGSAVVIAIRLLAAHFRWSLPKANGLAPSDEKEAAENDESTQEV